MAMPSTPIVICVQFLPPTVYRPPSCLTRAEQPIPGVAEARQEVACAIELAVE